MAIRAHTLFWRGFTLAPIPDVPGSWSVEDADSYIGVSYDSDDVENPEPDRSGKWSALLECGELDADGEGATAEQALEAALQALGATAADHVELVKKTFGGAS